MDVIEKKDVSGMQFNIAQRLSTDVMELADAALYDAGFFAGFIDETHEIENIHIDENDEELVQAYKDMLEAKNKAEAARIEALKVRGLLNSAGNADGVYEGELADGSVGEDGILKSNLNDDESDKLGVDTKAQESIVQEAEKLKAEATNLKKQINKEKEKIKAEAEKIKEEAAEEKARIAAEAEKIKKEVEVEKKNIKSQSDKLKAEVAEEKESIKAEAERLKAEVAEEKESIKAEAEKLKDEVERLKEKAEEDLARIAEKITKDAMAEAEKIKEEAAAEAKKLKESAKKQAAAEAEKAKAESQEVEKAKAEKEEVEKAKAAKVQAQKAEEQEELKVTKATEKPKAKPIKVAAESKAKPEKVDTAADKESSDQTTDNVHKAPRTGQVKKIVDASTLKVATNKTFRQNIGGIDKSSGYVKKQIVFDPMTKTMKLVVIEE